MSPSQSCLCRAPCVKCHTPSHTYFLLSFLALFYLVLCILPVYFCLPSVSPTGIFSPRGQRTQLYSTLAPTTVAGTPQTRNPYLFNDSSSVPLASGSLPRCLSLSPILLCLLLPPVPSCFPVPVWHPQLVGVVTRGLWGQVSWPPPPMLCLGDLCSDRPPVRAADQLRLPGSAPGEEMLGELG